MSYESYLQWKTEPLTERPVVSIVIPTFNEERRIMPTIGAIASHMCDTNLAWELIVADDGSTDRTRVLVESAELTNLRFVAAPRNMGKGAAVKRGMLAARGDYLLFADADCSTPIQEFDRLLSEVVTGKADVAIGSRTSSGSAAENRSLLRRTMTAGLRFIVQSVLRTRVRDTQCGFKLFTRSAAKDLFSRQTIEGFSFDLELLYLSYRLGLQVAEVPVRWHDAPGSKVEPLKEARRFLRDVASIRLKSLKGAYADA